MGPGTYKQGMGEIVPEVPDHAPQDPFTDGKMADVAALKMRVTPRPQRHGPDIHGGRQEDVRGKRAEDESMPAVWDIGCKRTQDLVALCHEAAESLLSDDTERSKELAGQPGDTLDKIARKGRGIRSWMV